MSHLRGSGDLEYSTWDSPGPISLLNPEIILPEADFRASHGKKKGWIVDWNGNPDELEREEDDIDKRDHKALYSEELDDFLDEMPDLEESESVNTSMYD